MLKRFVVGLAVVLLVSGCGNLSPTASNGQDQLALARIAAKQGTGFDQFGYNYNARQFVGPADGVDRVLDGKVWGDPTYAKDHLKMTWSKAWDDARFNGDLWNKDAWEDNQWNGMVPGGSGEVWHYKIVWVGPSLADSPYWRPGGHAVWGQFEVLMSHGNVDGVHIWDTHANPSGYGISAN